MIVQISWNISIPDFIGKMTFLLDEWINNSFLILTMFQNKPQFIFKHFKNSENKRLIPEVCVLGVVSGRRLVEGSVVYEINVLFHFLKLKVTIILYKPWPECGWPAVKWPIAYCLDNSLGKHSSALKWLLISPHCAVIICFPGLAFSDKVPRACYCSALHINNNGGSWFHSSPDSLQRNNDLWSFGTKNTHRTPWLFLY